MSKRLLSPREAIVWAMCLLLVASLLIVTKFTSDDPDSALYAALSARLSEGPPARWIAPEWWGHWDGEGLFREHPVGVLLLPTMLGAIGVPGVQAAYIVGVTAGLGSLFLLSVLIGRATSAVEGRSALMLLQVMPAASIFRIRANHEYPMLFCLLVTLLALERVHRSWWWALVVAAALSFGLLIKGVFVAILLLGAGLWILINPLRSAGSRWRQIVTIAGGIAAMAVVAAIYEIWYERVTGEPFWSLYWRGQLGPLTLATPVEGGTTLAGHLLFYVLRLLWHPAPWSLGLLIATWQRRHHLRAWWRSASEPARGGAAFALAFALAAMLLLSPASRFAERYVFSATYAIAALGVVVTCRAWPAIPRWVDRLDARVPALPALTWLGFMLLRLGLGPWLPRI